MEWTQEMRYRPYREWDDDYIKKVETCVKQSTWRLKYHVQPETGLLNDPNGFSFFNGKWHLFYQSFPFGPVHGLKSWHHVASKDLIHWESEEGTIEPSSSYDSHGAYSGSGIPVGEELFLAYTGNVRDEAWERKSYQLCAWMDADGNIEKESNPLIDQPPAGITAHFRDPQIIRYKEGYLMIIGGQTTAEKGEVLVFSSKELTEWEFQGPMKIDEDLGFMVECPNLLFLEGKTLLLLCPQGLDKKSLNYQNIYPNTYILAEDYLESTNELKNPQTQRVLDEGFDLYATQAFTAPDGRCLSVGWIGLPEMHYPTFEEGWAHSLSLVKELTIREGKLYQYPVIETTYLRQSEEVLDLAAMEKQVTETTNSYELQVAIPADCQGSILIFSDSTGEQALVLSYDTAKGTLQLDRSKTQYPLNPEFGETRESRIPVNESLKLALFVDRSTCEIFVNDGKTVLTANYYPTETQTNLVLQSTKQNNATYYVLEK